MDGLKESAGFIRSRLAKTVNLRITPELVFEIDDSLEYGARIDSILKELNIQKETNEEEQDENKNSNDDKNQNM